MVMIVKIHFINDIYIMEMYAFLSRYVLCRFSITFTLWTFITISLKTQVRLKTFQKIFCDKFQQASIILLPHHSTRSDLKVYLYLPKLLRWRQLFYCWVLFLLLGSVTSPCSTLAFTLPKASFFCTVVWRCQGLGFNLAQIPALSESSL